MSKNNRTYEDLANRLQTRNAELSVQISQETSRETVAPLALGTRYAELENDCRELGKQLASSRQQNLTVLTDSQRTMLKVLQDAIALGPTIYGAQAVNLLETPSYLSAALLGSVLPVAWVSSGLGISYGPFGGYGCGTSYASFVFTGSPSSVPASQDARAPLFPPPPPPGVSAPQK